MFASFLHRQPHLLALLSLSLLVGCAQRVAMPALRPAAAPVQGMRVLVVLPVVGPEDLSLLAQEKLIANLRQKPDYHLVEVADLDRAVGLSPHYRGGTPSLQDRLHAARYLGVDTLVEACVRPDANNGYSIGFANVVVGDQRVTIHLDVQLVDVASGRLRGEWTTSESFVGELSSNRKDSQSESRVMQRLAAACGQQAADAFVPREESVQVRLAGGMTAMLNNDLRAGVAAAREGDWTTARQHFASAHAADPENEAAIFNLALACEATNDFARARELYQQAVELDDAPRYSAGLERVERAAAEYELAMLQRSSHHVPETPQPPAPGQSQLATAGSQLAARQLIATQLVDGRLPPVATPVSNSGPTAPTQSPTAWHQYSPQQALPPQAGNYPPAAAGMIRR